MNLKQTLFVVWKNSDPSEDYKIAINEKEALWLHKQLNSKMFTVGSLESFVEQVWRDGYYRAQEECGCPEEDPDYEGRRECYD